MNGFKYTRAICREIPKSLVASAIRSDSSLVVNYEKAVKEHSNYIRVLKDLGLKVTILPAIESLPDCVFVEDPAVVIGKKAVVTNLGHPNRRDEAISIMQALQGHNIEVTRMEHPATLDGGDVLFTGREIFVGLSERSNLEGLAFLQSVFSEFPVHGVSVEDSLHLKSFMTMCNIDTILVSETQHAEKVYNELKHKATYNYDVVRVPDDTAANCLFVNGTLVHRSENEYPKSAKILQQLQLPSKEVEGGELEKVDGCLTCSSLLLE